MLFELDDNFDDTGSGLPVVLVHGHPFDRSMWRPQVEHFSRSHRVIAPDLRGYGANTPASDKTTLDVFAKDIADLMDHLEIDLIVLGGLSMGGQIVMEFARQFPERLLALLLADTFPGAETPVGRVARNDMADRLLREGMGPYAEEVLWKMVAPGNPEAAEHVLRMMKSAPHQGAAAALRGRAERRDYTELLRDISVPTLIAVGSDDEYTPVAEAERMHSLIPGSTLAVIEGAAHMPNLERPAEFNKAFQRLLNTVGA
ncbi:pimeloyl-ACP methyl ester carboxylesterase [Kibdelosporangium banguiense]|uniref:Pimeloyl-ACP methyl ester carboxylesterase n=1 Tax=Kibdelosporangium banguiense TaxID=1365924 RepID=A0ABS4T5X3_9PSEU|nr:alpha/beta fold hydrolase [Kibdelosporangium banguiense]MBP2319863.1 pimeloyl-ACP methyl ester carboxylesterase [Kibdelosporangium banguiense]